MGQPRHLWMAWIPHADQAGFPVPRLHPGGPAGLGSRAVPGSRPALPGNVAQGDSRMAFILFQEPHVRARTLSRARPFHPTDETQEHPALSARGKTDHTFRTRVLRLDKLNVDDTCEF